MGRLDVVVGAQFGSEGKGAVTAYLANRGEGALMAVRTGGPNAGHTVVDSKGVTWKLRQVPVAAVVDPLAQLVIAQGAEVDLDVLTKEVHDLDAAGYGVSRRLFVDSEATIIESDDLEREKNLILDIGSTGKGIGSARASRLMRVANRWRDVHDGVEVQGGSYNTAEMLNGWLHDGRRVLVEASQGFGLGLHAGYYPFCTSRDCRAIDALAECGISPWAKGVEEFAVWVVARTYPIRVAGMSGRFGSDETSWQELGLPEERTTVTNKVRRVAHWDGELVRRAVEANGGWPIATLAITMMDHKFNFMQGWTEPDIIREEVGKWLNEVQRESRTKVQLLGTGPHTMINLETPE